MSLLRSLILSMFAIGLWFGLTACALSPKDACKKTLEITCRKLHECTEESKKNDGFKLIAGESVSDCITKMETDRTIKIGAATITISGMYCEQKTEANACEKSDSGKIYHPDKALECLRDWESMTCAQITQSDGIPESPASCKLVCQAS